MSRKRELTEQEMSSLLSYQEVFDLDDGTEILVKWSTGQGPVVYTLTRFYGAIYVVAEQSGKWSTSTNLPIPLTCVGKSPMSTKVCLSLRPFKNAREKTKEIIKWM